MPSSRVVETDSGIQGEFNVAVYDKMHRRLRDKGWIETKEYGFSDRVEYIHSSGDKMPFNDGSFDAVFTNGSLHEWSNPKDIFSEIWRVLKKGGRVFISDLRRDMLFLLKWFLMINTKPKEIRPGLITSINAAYTPDELRELIKISPLSNCEVTGGPIGLKITGIK